MPVQRIIPNMLERAILLADDDIISPEHLPAEEQSPQHRDAHDAKSTQGLRRQKG